MSRRARPTSRSGPDRRRGRVRRPGAGRDRRRATLASVEMEVETAIGRTARVADDPRRPRLPGRHPRPAAAQAHRPVVLRAGAPGRPRLPDRRRCGRATCSSTTTSTCSEGGIGHLPDLCVTVPVFSRRAEVVAFVQAFGHHDDIGGAVPGLDAVARHQRVRGGPDGAADQALGRGRAQRGGARDHDPQLADARVAGRRPGRRVLGLPDGRAAARRAVRPLRRGDRRGVLRRDHRPHDHDLPTRDPLEDPGRQVRRGRTTPSTTASTSRGCTRSGSR